MWRVQSATGRVWGSAERHLWRSARRSSSTPRWRWWPRTCTSPSPLPVKQQSTIRTGQWNSSNYFKELKHRHQPQLGETTSGYCPPQCKDESVLAGGWNWASLQEAVNTGLKMLLNGSLEVLAELLQIWNIWKIGPLKVKHFSPAYKLKMSNFQPSQSITPLFPSALHLFCSLAVLENAGSASRDYDL